MPKSVRRKAGLTAGDLLQVEITADGCILLTAVVAAKQSQRYFWTERWQAGERETEEDLRDKRFETFTATEDFVTDLKNEG